MAFVLDSPVAADTLVHSGSCHFQCFPAGEDEGVLLADPVAGDLEDLAADAGGLGCMRKIDAVGAGEPAGPFLYPSPAALLHDVVRSSGGKLSFPAGMLNFESSCGVCDGWGRA